MKKIIFILIMCCSLISSAIIINNPDGTKVWFTSLAPGEPIPLTIADSAIISKLDSVVSLLSRTTDSIYILQISNGIKQLDGTIDSFNCSSVNFVWQSTATGTAIITGSDGNIVSFSPTDELPNWQVNEPNKLGQIIVDATNATGLRAIYQGCEAPCLKKFQALNCVTGQPVELSGWQTQSGYWQTSSGIWSGQ